MKTKVYAFIAFRIIMLFSLAIASTFIPEHLRDFFGDKLFVADKNPFGYYTRHEDGTFDTEWVWGSRHYWFQAMMICLFVLAVIDAFASITKIIEKNYPQFR